MKVVKIFLIVSLSFLYWMCGGGKLYVFDAIKSYTLTVDSNYVNLSLRMENGITHKKIYLDNIFRIEKNDENTLGFGIFIHYKVDYQFTYVAGRGIIRNGHVITEKEARREIFDLAFENEKDRNKFYDEIIAIWDAGKFNNAKGEKE